MSTTTCPFCGADIQRLHERDFRDKLLAAATHPDADVVVRAAAILVSRHDPAAVDMIAAAIDRFDGSALTVSALLNVLTAVNSERAASVAERALHHRSALVRKAAEQLLAHRGTR